MLLNLQNLKSNIEHANEFRSTFHMLKRFPQGSFIKINEVVF